MIEKVLSLPAEPDDKKADGPRRKLLVQNLLKLSTYQFFGNDASKDFEPSGVADAVRELSGDAGKRFGDDIVALANELIQRWDAGNREPKLLQTPVAEPASSRPAPLPSSPAPQAPPPPPRFPAIYGHDYETGDLRYCMFHLNNAVYQELVRGIVRTTGDGGRRYPTLNINPRPSNIFGHNNIPLGKWWILQLTVRRDGGHGAAIAGIYGAASEGAFSVISSGSSGYFEADEDQGDWLWYAGSHSDDARMTAHSELLVKSHQSRQPVRVIRAKGASSWAPSIGYRYDGLYQVAEYELATRRDGHQYWRFKLVRMPNQESLASIHNRSPTPHERAAYMMYEEIR